MIVSKIDLDLLIKGSDRNITENLRPIENGQRRRTINGDLKSLGSQHFNKYELNLNGTDLRSPSLDGIWLGDTIQIGCLTELTYLAKKPLSPTPTNFTYPDGSAGSGHAITVSREFVPSSLIIRDVNGLISDPVYADGMTIYLSDFDRDYYVTYRPILTVMVDAWDVSEAEREATVNWSFKGIEI